MLEQKKILYLDALASTLGNVTEATNAVGISRSTHYTWLRDDEEFRAAFEAADYGEQLKDLIEKKLVEKLNLNDTAVIIFMAKTKCKDRGYIERQEIDVSKIPVNWIEEKYSDNEINEKANGGDQSPRG
jgi:transposase